MIRATCTRCGSRFHREPEAEWKRLCLDCWKATKARTTHRTKADADECLRWYRQGFEAGRAEAQTGPAQFDRQRLRELLQLAHPDKHGGSALAVRVTQWLNDLKRGVTA